MEKHYFTIIKEKIIKTNELLVLYKEKSENYDKAKHAFKQLKSKYDAAMHETNRLKMDNERLNYSLETIRPKYEQAEKDLVELRADYTRIDEKYQQNMIESQLTISELEEKVKHCTSEIDLSLSPSKRNTPNEKVKEIKKISKDLKEIESNLKNKSENLQLKNKELKAERFKHLKIIEDFTAKNSNLQKKLMVIKDKVHKMELASNDQTNLQLTIKQNHEKEICALKSEISKLSFDKKRIKYLELERMNLKQQINSSEMIKIKKSDCCVQTENTLDNVKNPKDSSTAEKISILDQKCRELQKKLTYFEHLPVFKEDISIQVKIAEPMHTLKVWEDDSSDCGDSISEILSEMILPKALSPLSFSSRLTETPTPPFLSMLEELPPLDKYFQQQESFVQKPIPNIVITPPTPSIEKSSYSNEMFPVLTENSEEKQPNENMDEATSVVVNHVFTTQSKETINIYTHNNESSISKVQEPRMSNANTNKIVDSPDEQLVSTLENTHTDKNWTTLSETLLPPIQNEEIAPTEAEFEVEKEVLFKCPAPISENNLSIKNTCSVATATKEMITSERFLENQVFSSDKGIYSAPINLVSTCEKSVSTETDLGTKTHWSSPSENSKSFQVSHQKDSLNLKNKFQRPRKFWIPYNMNSLVKLKKRRKTAKVTKKYNDFSSNEPKSDTILNALRTLQQNHINFTISNESIPLVQPYNCYSLLTPPKVEPITICRKFTDTFSYSLNCWNRQCTVNNTQMLLRNIQNEEEPELLGFFNIKDEVITPSASRMAVLEKPKPAKEENLIAQLLSGIKELIDVKRKESSANRRKKRSKSKNRRSDFYSETETELEKLFRKSADVLGRNRRFFAAAKEQNLESNEESMFETESDDLVDSGLVTGTPKFDSDSLSISSQNELGEVVVSDIFGPIIRNTQDVVLQRDNKDTIAALKDHKNSIGFSLPSDSSSTMIKSADVFKHELSLLGNCTTTKFSTCPVSMLSPETLQVCSTPFKIPEPKTNSRTSPDCFKRPFCPIMISPMASSAGSPVTQIFKDNKIKHKNEDSFASFRMPLCPASPLAPFPSAISGNCLKNLETTDNNHMTGKSCPLRENNMEIQGSNNVDTSKLSNINLYSLNEVNSSEILASYAIKPLCNENTRSLVCQRIAFDSVEDNEQLDQVVNVSNMDSENCRELLLKSSLLLNFGNNSSTFLDGPDISRDDNVISVTSNILEDKKEYLTKADTCLHSEKNIPIHANKLNLSEIADKSYLPIDFSPKSSDLNCTLHDISISELELSSAIHKEPNEVPSNDNDLVKRACPVSKQTSKPIKNKSPIEFADSNIERRYSLRTKSRFEAKNCDNFKLGCHKVISFGAENTVDFISPRTRAAKRKLEEDSNCNGKEKVNITKESNSPELDELTGSLKKKRGRPRNVDKITVSSHNKCLNDSKYLDKLLAKIPSQKVNKLERNQKEEGNNAEDGNISSKCDINISKRDTVGINKTSEDEEQQKNVKKVLKHLKRKSGNSNKDVSKDLFDKELKGIGDANSNKDIKNPEETTLGVLGRKSNEAFVSEIMSPEGTNCPKDTETILSKERQTGCRSRKIINKEFISESQSECDISSMNHIETNYQASIEELFQKNISGSEQEQSTGNSVNCQGPALKKNDSSDLSRSKKTSKKDTFCGRNLFEESDHVKKNNVFSDINEHEKKTIGATTGNSDNSHPSKRDIFKDVSGCEEETRCSKSKGLKVTQKNIPKKAATNHKLKKKMSIQVKNIICANKNNDCDVNKSYEGKPEKRLQDISEERCLNKKRKINVVQNILISKGKTFNLLSNRRKSKCSSSTTNLKAVENIKCLPPKVNKDKSCGTSPRTKIKLEQNISNTSTPVDILSQVMHGMIKTGPKTARKNASNYLSSDHGRQHRRGIFTNKPENILHDDLWKPWKGERKLAEENTDEVTKSLDEFLDCPKSPDIMEVPDRLPKLIPTKRPVKLPPSKVRILMDKLMIFSNETKMLDAVIKEFAFQDMTFMVEIIIDKLSQDYRDKADNTLPPSPPMTSTQRTLLGFLLKLDRSTHPGIRDKFLSLAELQLFNMNTCRLEIVQPITRLYTALLKLNYDLNKIRRFIGEGFYFMSDLAVPMFFTVLTMWPEALPMESETSDNLLAKVIIQICNLKECKQPGYNILPLRDLFKKYYGYPAERWNCEVIFKDLMVEYIRNPSLRLSDFSLLLFLKNKPTKWVYQKVKETIIPLYNQASDSNPNLKATLLILLANICCGFKKYEDYDWSVIVEMDKWFVELDRDNLDPIGKRSLHLARCRLPRRPRIRKQNESTESNKTDNSESNNCETTRNCAEKLTLEGIRQENCKYDYKANTEGTAAKGLKKEYSKSTNNNVNNIDSKLDDSNQTKCEYERKTLVISLSKC